MKHIGTFDGKGQIPNPVPRSLALLDTKRKPTHTCADDNHAPCLVPQCRPLEWYETEYGKQYMDTQRHEGKV